MNPATDDKTINCAGNCSGNCPWQAKCWQLADRLRTVIPDLPDSPEKEYLERIVERIKTSLPAPSAYKDLDELLPVVTHEDAGKLDGILAQQDATVQQRILLLLSSGAGLRSVFREDFLASCNWSHQGTNEKRPFNVYQNIVNILNVHFGNETKTKAKMQKIFKNEHLKHKRNTFSQRSLNEK